MDAEEKGIVPGDIVEYFDDVDQPAIYIGKIPYVTIDDNGSCYGLCSDELWPNCPDHQDEQQCIGACVWHYDMCHPTNFKVEFQVGDIIPIKSFQGVSMVKVASIDNRDAVYTGDGVKYTSPGEYGT